MSAIPAAADITVVIPVRDGMTYLGETLDAVLDQTLAPLEIVVVDDGSNDGSGEYAASRSELIRTVRGAGLGPEGARQLGVSHCRGDVVAFCDADDLWLPTKLERQRALITDVGRPHLVWTGIDEFISPDVDGDQYKGRAPFVDVIGARLVSSLMMTAATIDAASLGFDEAGNWMAWVARLPGSVEVSEVREVLMRRRLHLSNFGTGDLTSGAAVLAAARERARRSREHA